MLALQEICEKEGLNFDYIKKNYIDFYGLPINPEKLISLNSEQRKYLTSHEVKSYLQERVLTFDESISLTLEEIRALATEERPLLIKFLQEGLDFAKLVSLIRKESIIGEEDLFELTVVEQRKYLTSDEVWLYLMNHLLTLDEIINLTKEEVRALAERKDPLQARCAQDGMSWLEFEVVERYIKEELTTNENFWNLPPEQRKYLVNSEVRIYLSQEVLTWDQAISLTKEEIRVLAKEKNPLLASSVIEGWNYYNIKKYIQQEPTTEEVFLKLTPKAREYLASEEVKEYLRENILTWVQTLSLTQEEIRNLADEKMPLRAKYIQERLDYHSYNYCREANKRENITEEDFLKSTTPEHRRYLTSKEVELYLERIRFEEQRYYRPLLTWRQAISLTQEQIRTLVEKKHPLFAKCVQEDIPFRFAKDYIQKGLITQEEFLSLRSGQRQNITNQQVKNLIDEDLITFSQALGLKHTNVKRLEKDYWRQVGDYLKARLINLDVALKLPLKHIKILLKPGMHYALEMGFIALEEITSDKIKMSWDHKVFLEEDRIIEIGGQKCLLGELLNIKVKYYETLVEVLKSPYIIELLQENKIALSDILESKIESKWNLKDPYGKGSFAMSYLTEPVEGQTLPIKQILEASYEQFRNLYYKNGNTKRDFNDPNDTLRKCLEENVFTLKEFLELTRTVPDTLMVALADQATRRAYKVRKVGPPALTLVALFEMNIREVFNPQQSTHTTSVNKSVKESIKKLGNLYGTQVTSIEVDIILEEILENIETFILNFEKDKVYKEHNPKSTDIFLADNILQAAKRCIEELKLYKAINPYRYYEASNNSRYYELVLVWRAIHDDNKRIGSLEDAKKQIITGLYEIQRGNNIDSKGNDDKLFDLKICAEGTVHKLLEKLQGIHPDVEIIYLTPSSAAAKLPYVVKEITRKYLKENPELIEKVKESRDVEPIWESIKEQVTDVMFEEFGDVPQFLTHVRKDKNNKKFRKMIDGGMYTPIVNKDLERVSLAGPNSLVNEGADVGELTKRVRGCGQG